MRLVLVCARVGLEKSKVPMSPSISTSLLSVWLPLLVDLATKSGETETLPVRHVSIESLGTLINVCASTRPIPAALVDKVVS